MRPTSSFPIPSSRIATSGTGSWRSWRAMPAEAQPRTPPDLIAMKAAGRKIAVLTCYDAAFARLIAPEVDLLLVGDSVNQVVAGRETTLSATLDQLIYHASAVRRGSADALIVVDLPYLTYQ